MTADPAAEALAAGMRITVQGAAEAATSLRDLYLAENEGTMLLSSYGAGVLDGMNAMVELFEGWNRAAGEVTAEDVLARTEGSGTAPEGSGTD